MQTHTLSSAIRACLTYRMPWRRGGTRWNLAVASTSISGRCIPAYAKRAKHTTACASNDCPSARKHALHFEPASATSCLHTCEWTYARTLFINACNHPMHRPQVHVVGPSAGEGRGMGQSLGKIGQFWMGLEEPSPNPGSLTEHMQLKMCMPIVEGIACTNIILPCAPSLSPHATETNCARRTRTDDFDT